MRQTLQFFFAAACAIPGFLFSGCYTQFATLEEKAVSPERTVTIIDSTGKQVTVVRPIDTVPTIDRETCIWERDPMGFPTLHCYKGYYPREWYLYNFSPWWYRTDAYLYSAGRCPPFYYYDDNCGCCRYYLNNPDALRPKSTSADNEAKASAEPAIGKVSVDSQGNRVNISAGSRSTFYSRQRVKPGQPTRSLAPSSVTTTAPSTVAKPDSTDKTDDSTTADSQPSASGSGADSVKLGVSATTVQQSTRQDTIHVPPSRPQVRRSIRSR